MEWTGVDWVGSERRYVPSLMLTRWKGHFVAGITIVVSQSDRQTGRTLSNRSLLIPLITLRSFFSMTFFDLRYSATSSPTTPLQAICNSLSSETNNVLPPVQLDVLNDTDWEEVRGRYCLVPTGGEVGVAGGSEDTEEEQDEKDTEEEEKMGEDAGFDGMIISKPTVTFPLVLRIRTSDCFDLDVNNNG
jgi:hypothetical protein